MKTAILVLLVLIPLSVTVSTGIAKPAKTAGSSSNSSTGLTFSDIAKMTNKPAFYVYHCNKTIDTQPDVNNATAVLTQKPMGSSLGLNSSTSYVCIVTTTMSEEDRQRTAGTLETIQQGIK